MNSERDGQREIARISLDILRGTHFALAGSGAIREHGIVDRDTQDVDLFTDELDADTFDAQVDLLVAGLPEIGMRVEEVRRSRRFAQLRVTTRQGQEIDVDLAVDWREREPVVLPVGRVLDLDDAVASKVGALFSRAEARDYLDVEAIRRSGRFTDAELIDAAAARDAGFDTRIFADQLAHARRVPFKRVERYGLTEAEWERIQMRFVEWADRITGVASAD